MRNATDDTEVQTKKMHDNYKQDLLPIDFT